MQLPNNNNNDKHETQSRAQSSYFKKRIMDRINAMDDKELQRMGHDLNIDEGANGGDKASVIT